MKPHVEPGADAMLRNLRVQDQIWQLGRRTYIMGILNVTPDSFSDGGRFTALAAAVEQARKMVAEGADIIDVGGESTRPGHVPVPPAEEARRVVPVVAALRAELPVPISVDTSKAEVARLALAAGADMVNDVTGLRGDPDMAHVVARAGVPVVIMHNCEVPAGPNLMPAIALWLRESIQIAQRAGVALEQMIVDPGVGFGKDVQGNLQLIANLWQLATLRCPILLGTSRKSVIGKTLNLPVEQRVEGTAATVALGIAGGAHIVRVHDVQAMLRVARMTDAVVAQGRPPLNQAAER